MTHQTDMQRAQFLLGAITAEEAEQEIDDRLAALSPATAQAVEAAFKLIGDEIARQEVLAERAGESVLAQRLAAGLRCLYLAASAIDDSMLLNDFLRDADYLRDELAELPPPDPDKDDAWVLRPGDSPPT